MTVDLCLAIDIGGTKLAAGLVSAAGDLLGAKRAPTPRTDDADELFAALAASWTACSADEHGPVLPRAPRWSVCGVGCGGPMDLRRGTVSPLNIPAWRRLPLAGRDSKRPPASWWPWTTTPRRSHWAKGGRGRRVSGGTFSPWWCPRAWAGARRRRPVARRRVGERRSHRPRDRRARWSSVPVRGAGMSRSRSIGHRHRGDDGKAAGRCPARRRGAHGSSGRTGRGLGGEPSRHRARRGGWVGRARVRYPVLRRRQCRAACPRPPVVHGRGAHRAERARPRTAPLSARVHWVGGPPTGVWCRRRERDHRRPGREHRSDIGAGHEAPWCRRWPAALGCGPPPIAEAAAAGPVRLVAAVAAGPAARPGAVAVPHGDGLRRVR